MITPRQKATIFGRYPNQQVISKFGDKYVLHGLTFGEQAAVLNLGDAAYSIDSFSLLLTDLKDITEEHAKLVCELADVNFDNSSADKEYYYDLEGFKDDIESIITRHENPALINQLLMLLGYATDQCVLENGNPVTYSVPDLVKFNVFKIRK